MNKQERRWEMMKEKERGVGCDGDVMRRLEGARGDVIGPAWGQWEVFAWASLTSATARVLPPVM